MLVLPWAVCIYYAIGGISWLLLLLSYFGAVGLYALIRGDLVWTAKR